jgi:hypothetical protein
MGEGIAEEVYWAETGTGRYLIRGEDKGDTRLMKATQYVGCSM